MSYTTDLPVIFPDFVTSRNLVLFIISKEYLDNSDINQDLSESAKFRFYHFLFSSIKGSSVDLFSVIKNSDGVLKKQLSIAVVDRISRLVGDINELITYTHILELINSVLSTVHEREDVMDNDRTGTVCKYSLIGIFMKKFALAFNSMPIEKMLNFIDGFKKVVAHYGLIKIPSKEMCCSSYKINERSLKLKCERLSEDQVLSSLEKIYKNVDNILFQPNSDRSSINNLRTTLKSYKNMYPHISDTSFLDHLLSIKNKNLESFEKDIQNNFPARFLSKDDDTSVIFKSLQLSNKDSKNTIRAINLFKYHKKMSEISLNSAATLLSMDFKNEALLHYKNALFNAKLSKNTNLLDDVKNVGNSMMPINDNPNPMVFSKNSDTLSDKAALGNIRVSILQYLHNSHSSLAELLQLYFSSVAPQRRDITPICLIYLSIIFRSFGFQSLANTYMLIAGCLESVRRTQNHEKVIVEVFLHLMENFTALGHFEKTMIFFKSLQSLGDGILCDNYKIQSSKLQCYFNHSIRKLEFTKAHLCIEKLKHFSLAEYGLRRVQLLFMEDNNIAADRLGNHIISFAIKKRDLLIYNHVSLSTGRPTISSTILDHITSGVVENSLEAIVTKEFLTLDDIGSQSWGSRDWALFECRCRWLMCSQLINHRQFDTARNHLEALRELSMKFYFYHFIRLCQFLQLSLESFDNDQDKVPFISPLALNSNKKKAGSILSSRMGLSQKNEMIFSNLILKLYVNEDRISRDIAFESQLSQLENYCRTSEDYIGHAHCLQMWYIYSARCGDEASKAKVKYELEILLENRCVNVHNLDFLANVL